MQVFNDKIILTGLAPEEFRCLVPECNETSENHYDFLHFGYEIFPRDKYDNVNFCKQYPVRKNLSEPLECKTNSTLHDFDFTVPEDELVLCTANQNIIYGEFGMDWTVVTRFNLVCDDEYKVHKLNSHQYHFYNKTFIQ